MFNYSVFGIRIFIPQWNQSITIFLSRYFFVCIVSFDNESTNP